MREIKFRAWDKDKKEWLKEEDIIIDCDGTLLLNEAQTLQGNYVLMQYTGRKDKNSKEIYEEDIVKTKFGVVNLIQFENSCWIMINRLTNPHVWLRFSDNPEIEKDLEIIGNLYENPELLKS